MTTLYNERRRVLLIDENSRRLNLLTTILRNHEVEVHPANRMEEARSYWKNIPYDLILLAAAESSEEATLASLEIRRNHPRQRIALLVGPPSYVREIGRPLKSRTGSQPMVEVTALNPQWPAIVQKVVNDWYVDRTARFALDRVAAPVSVPPFLAD